MEYSKCNHQRMLFNTVAIPLCDDFQLIGIRLGLALCAHNM